jgi:hypothetical protein
LRVAQHRNRVGGVAFCTAIAYGKSDAKDVALQDRFRWSRRCEAAFVTVDAMRKAGLLKSGEETSCVGG